MKKLPDGSTGSEAEYSRAYLQHGIHRNVINWQEDSELGTKIVCDLQPGIRVERWGSEAGYYLADEGTPFKALQLPVSSYKLNHSSYEVIKPFSVTESVITQQPFDGPAENNEKYRQFKTEKPIERLIETGYLLRIKNSSTIDSDERAPKSNNPFKESEEVRMRMDGLSDDESKKEQIDGQKLDDPDQIRENTEEQKGVFAKIFDKLKGKETNENQEEKGEVSEDSGKKELSEREKFIESIKYDGPPIKYEKNSDKLDNDGDNDQNERVRERDDFER